MCGAYGPYHRQDVGRFWAGLVKFQHIPMAITHPCRPHRARAWAGHPMHLRPWAWAMKAPPCGKIRYMTFLHARYCTSRWRARGIFYLPMVFTTPGFFVLGMSFNSISSPPAPWGHGRHHLVGEILILVHLGTNQARMHKRMQVIHGTSILYMPSLPAKSWQMKHQRQCGGEKGGQGGS